MSLATETNLSAIERFAADDAAIYLKECDGNFSPLTTGDGTQFVCIGTTKGTEIAPVVSNFTDNGDSGGRVVDKDTFESLEVTTTLMQRDANSRNLPKNASGKKYQILIKGQRFLNSSGTTVQEVWAGTGTVKLGNWKYPIGGDGQMQTIKIVTLSNPQTVSITLPSAFTTGTVTVTIAALEQYKTEDVTP